MRVYRVNLTEYEKGWGSKVFDTLYFKKEENALSYIKEYNSKNNLKMTPDYYTKAEYIGAGIITDNFKLEDEEDNNFEIDEFINLTSRYCKNFDCWDYYAEDILDILIEQDICTKEKLIHFREQIKQKLKGL